MTHLPCANFISLIGTLARPARSAKRQKASLAGRFGGKENGGGGASAASAGMTAAQLRELVDMTLKMAAESKINARNVWELRLIDRLPEVIRAESGAGACSRSGSSSNSYSCWRHCCPSPHARRMHHLSPLPPGFKV